MTECALQKYLARGSCRFLPLLLLALVVTVSAFLNYLNIRSHADQMALHYAEGLSQLLLSTRTWNAEHGGVYVPITDKDQPNPYLQIPHRDPVSEEGLRLTMINPAYMTRQIGEIARRQTGLVIHIFSRQPLNPLNAADPWELASLDHLEQGGKSWRLTLQHNPEGSVFRYMIPLQVEESCLTCHTRDGYQVGELRGGISLTFPADPHFAILRSQKMMMFFGHFLGFLVVGAVLTLLLNHLRQQWRAMEKVLSEQEKTIAQRTLKLERSNAELRDFAQIASHDLQEPLRTIVSFGNRLLLKHSAQLDDKGRDYLERIEKAATRMGHLIQDLLNYSRVASQEQRLTPVNLNELLSEVLDDLEQRRKECGGRVEIDPLGSVNGDRNLLHRLFLNLIGNALKFHRQGVRPLVRVSRTELDDGRVQILVEDNGIGFDEKYLDRIFRPFQRLHLRGQYPGTGMGLAICKKIVENHHGELYARSQPGEGTTFIMVLPL
ncbi:MAG TPA: DUF3365 domain-containing protein [Desulfurivibrio alkaliphilus]|uniref:histidine kinase n=1 Tax=Desulfurivibrio alkaliphilus TaxID=427923 RepID=A0A7C2TGM0_9BACT|nr:DUF3365 domain-containing protein [Desulfurivibrio alkaliphilus]